MIRHKLNNTIFINGISGDKNKYSEITNLNEQLKKP